MEKMKICGNRHFKKRIVLSMLATLLIGSFYGCKAIENDNHSIIYEQGIDNEFLKNELCICEISKENEENEIFLARIEKSIMGNKLYDVFTNILLSPVSTSSLLEYLCEGEEKESFNIDELHIIYSRIYYDYHGILPISTYEIEKIDSTDEEKYLAKDLRFCSKDDNGNKTLYLTREVEEFFVTKEYDVFTSVCLGEKKQDMINVYTINDFLLPSELKESYTKDELAALLELARVRYEGTPTLRYEDNSVLVFNPIDDEILNAGEEDTQKIHILLLDQKSDGAYLYKELGSDNTVAAIIVAEEKVNLGYSVSNGPCYLLEENNIYTLNEYLLKRGYYNIHDVYTYEELEDIQEFLQTTMSMQHYR